MRKLLAAYARNSVTALLTDSPWFAPMAPVLYVTPMCNLRCTYCEDFGAQRNDGYKGHVLPLADLERLVDILADVADVLYVTGGEPTMRDDLGELLAHARTRGIGHLSLNTNGTLLRERAELLPQLDVLVISLDSLESGRWDSTLAERPDKVQALRSTIEWAASRQRIDGFRLVISTVVTPGRIDAARGVRDFCFRIGAAFSPQHLSEGRRISPALQRDPELPRFIDELLAAKRRGQPVSGSEAYLRAMVAPQAFRCAPLTLPHVDWRGRLAFPCRELPDHVLVDVLAAGSYEAALAEGRRRFGAPPTDCQRCGERCYLELSTLVRRPHLLGREIVGYLRERSA